MFAHSTVGRRRTDGQTGKGHPMITKANIETMVKVR